MRSIVFNVLFFWKNLDMDGGDSRVASPTGMSASRFDMLLVIPGQHEVILH